MIEQLHLYINGYLKYIYVFAYNQNEDIIAPLLMGCYSFTYENFL